MKKIRTKIMLLIIIATMGVTTISSAQSMMNTQSSTISAIERTLAETVELAALAAQNMISTYTLTISEIATNPVLLDENASAEDKQAFLQTKIDAYYMRFGGIADVNGYDVAHNMDISGEPFFQASLSGQNYMSAPYIEDNDKYLIVSAPIIQDGTVQGIVYFQCDTNILQSIVEGIQIGEEGEAYILDKEGTTIACKDEQAVLNQENLIHNAETYPDDKDIQTLAAIERRMTAGESGVQRYSYLSDNTNNIQGYTPIPGTDGWSVAVIINEDEFMQSAYLRNMNQFITCVLLCIVIIVISFAIVKHFIAAPIVKCTNRLQALSEGDLKSPVPKIKGKDEIHTLSLSTAHLVENFDLIVEEMGTVLSSIANGDLTKDSISEHYPGDFKTLQEYLQIINQKLNQTMKGIVRAASQVSNGSTQAAASSSMLSQGALEQSSAVEQLSSTITEMSHDAKTAAQLTRQVKDMVDSAGNELQESSRYIQHLNEAMDLITNTSNQISHIIDAIEDIAFQTNILALNASVEAARAGEAGRGFAVVAGEVRELAAKSDEAAKATLELISSSIKAVNSGSQIVAKVTDSVTDAASTAGQATEQMEAVAEAVERQTTAMEQITMGIGQISNVVQANTATAEESAATSDELSSQAATLNQLVGSFTLR